MHVLQPDLKPGEMGTIPNTILAGCSGGFLQCTVLVPIEVVKCTMQANQPTTTLPPQKSSNMLLDTWHCIRTIYRAEGIRGFYKGFTATVSRECPSFGPYFLSYRQTKEFCKQLEGTETPSTASILFSGGVAGAVSWGCIYPFDVIKTNLQINTTPIKEAMNTKGETTVFSMAKYLYRKHGMRVFFNGLGITLVRAFPVNASTFYVYEKLKEHFFP
jgi:solute carrier family 25 carnitine/acylcarnitine transporter 20/29